MGRVLAVLLVLVMLGSVMSQATAADTVGVNEAKKVAGKFIERITATDDFKDWRKVKLGRIVPAYDVDESRTAYIIELVKDGKYAGYIVVSAKKTNYPVLEFSKGKSPLARMKELGIEAEKVYRIGGMTYIAKEKGRYYDLKNRKVDFNKLRESAMKALEDVRIKNHLAKRALKAREQWEKYDYELNKKLVSTLSWYSEYISEVPAFYWDDGCTPTAAAMVLEYWGEHGYPNLDYPDSWYFETTDIGDNNGYDNPPSEYMDLTEELHLAMGTSDEDGSTYFWNIDDGINAVCSAHGYSFYAWNTWFPVWGQVVNEIDAGRPFVLSMWHGGTGSGWETPYGDHSVTVIGFLGESESGAEYVIIHDTWDLSDHYLAFGDWWGAVATWVWP